jgi:hypothetical protein
MPSINLLVLLTTLQIAAAGATKEPILPFSTSATVSYPHGLSSSSSTSSSFSEDLFDKDELSILPSPLGHSKMHKRSGTDMQAINRRMDKEYVFFPYILASKVALYSSIAIRRIREADAERADKHFWKTVEGMLKKKPEANEGPSLSRQGSSVSSHYSDAMSAFSDAADEAVDASSVKPPIDHFVPTPGYKIVSTSRDPNDPIVEWKIPEDKEGRLPGTFETIPEDLSDLAKSLDDEIFKKAPGQSVSRPPANSLSDVIAKGDALDAFMARKKAGNSAPVAPAARAPATVAKPPNPRQQQTMMRKQTAEEKHYEIQKYAAQKFGLPEPPKPGAHAAAVREADRVRQAAPAPVTERKPFDTTLVVSLKKLLEEADAAHAAEAAAAETAKLDPAGPSTSTGLTAPKPDKHIPGMMSKEGSHSSLIKVPSFEVTAKQAAKMGHKLSEEAHGIAQASAIETAQKMASAISKLHL